MNAKKDILSMLGRDDHDLLTALRRALLLVAQQEDARATQDAVRTRYWEPVPESVVGHRAAACALRRAAEEFSGQRLAPAS